ncbi:MAG TPA: LamG domain-containing protein, partial [Casimicrobium sp.]|nr:LamG domain-containing protein [Casimicrobium sp.]
NAFALDGATNYLATPTSVAGATSGGSFTLAMWIRPTKDFNTLPSGLSGESVFMKKSSGISFGNKNACAWKIDTDTDRIQFLVFNETGSVVVNSFALNTTWEAATWYHIAVKFDGAGYTFYLNGLQDGYTADSYGVGTTTGHNILIGRDNSPGEPQFFNGCIDDALIFNRALTAEEVKKLYDETIKQNGEPW